jgi:hypothetical protein
MLAVAALSTLTAGCSVLMPAPSPGAAKADQIGVYESSPPGSRDYRFVTRLWVEPWRSAIRVPRYGSEEAGIADLRAQAVALGGDAIINFACYHIAVDPKSDYICNGTVVKFLP